MIEHGHDAASEVAIGTAGLEIESFSETTTAEKPPVRFGTVYDSAQFC